MRMSSKEYEQATRETGMPAPLWRGLRTYSDICEYAEWIERDGPHDAWIMRGGSSRERWTCDAVQSAHGALYVWPVARGGRCYSVDVLLHDDRTREAVKRTAALGRTTEGAKQ